MTAFDLALRNLRHLYEQMLDGRVQDTASAARGLLGPAIEMLESLQQIDRRSIPRQVCNQGCDLPINHKGPHRAPCGCINGCKAWGCPNL